MLGWPKRSKLARAFPWEYSYKGLKLAQLLGRLGVSLTAVQVCSSERELSPQALSDDFISSYYVEGCMEGCMRACIIRYFPLTTVEVCSSCAAAMIVR